MDRFRTLCWATMLLLTVFIVIVFIVVLAQCVPLSNVWDYDSADRDQCINDTVFHYTTAVVNIVSDIWILVLPIRAVVIKGGPRPKKEQIVLIAAFGMGAVACVASIVRLHTVRVFTHSQDRNVDSVPVTTLSIIETNVAAMCACISALRSFVTSRPRRGGNSSSESGANLDSQNRAVADANHIRNLGYTNGIGVDLFREK